MTISSGSLKINVLIFLSSDGNLSESLEEKYDEVIIIKWLSLRKVLLEKFIEDYYKCFIYFMQCKPHLMAASLVSLLLNYGYLPNKYQWEV